VTIFARPLSLLARVLGVPSRAMAVVALAIAVLLAFAVAPAGAVVSELGPTTVGLQPRNVASVLDGNGEVGATFANASGNPVLHATNTYVIYWDPTDHYHGDWQNIIDTFMQQVGSASGTLSNVFAVDAQYTDKSNKPASYHSTYRGAYTDSEKYPVAGCTDPHPLEAPDAITCLTDAQLREQLTTFITQHGLQKGMSTVFYLLTPPGVTVCIDAAATRCSDYTRSAKEVSEKKYESASYLNSLCSYHSDINPGGTATGDANTVLYAAIPWTAGGIGDYHLKGADQTGGLECQDGGFDPSSKPIEKKEKPKEKTAKEVEEFEKKTVEEKQVALEATERENPHEQQPNQVGLGPDGSYDTGLADLIVNQIAVEQQNTVTNPLLNAWADSSRNELTDECRNFFASGSLSGSVSANESTLAGTLVNQTIGTGNYYLNTAFNLASTRLPYPGVPCMGGVTLEPKFTAPTPVNAGDVAGFDGMESNITLDAAIGFSAGGAPQSNYATYTWNFGDGSPTVSGYAPGAPACETPWLTPCAASVFHSYQYGGTYQVSLTVTDVGGNTAAVSRPVIVVGPPPPSKESGSSGGSAGSAGSSGGTSQAGGSAGGSPAAPASPPIPTPVAAQAVISRSLRAVARTGLVVRYSVNEQVAGHFDVLLSRSLARALGIGGPAAVGLPPGTPPQVVIAKALLVATGAGRSTVTIQFSKRTASRLARRGRVGLMLRLIVRNAAPQNPSTTTVLSSFTLTR
jgi:hypothetical protein